MNQYKTLKKIMLYFLKTLQKVIGISILVLSLQEKCLLSTNLSMKYSS